MNESPSLAEIPVLFVDIKPTKTRSSENAYSRRAWSKTLCGADDVWVVSASRAPHTHGPVRCDASQSVHTEVAMRPAAVDAGGTANTTIHHCVPFTQHSTDAVDSR